MHVQHHRRLIPLTAILAFFLFASTGSAEAASRGDSGDVKVRALNRSKAVDHHDRRGHGDVQYAKHQRHDRRHRYDRRHRDDRHRYDRHRYDRRHRDDRHHRYDHGTSCDTRHRHGRYDRHRHHRPYEGYGRYDRHFEIPRTIHHHDRYRDYYYGRIYHRDHRHHHRIYRFPVYVEGYLEYRPYAYCGDRHYATGYFGVDGPRFSLRIGF